MLTQSTCIPLPFNPRNINQVEPVTSHALTQPLLCSIALLLRVLQNLLSQHPSTSECMQSTTTSSESCPEWVDSPTATKSLNIMIKLIVVCLILLFVAWILMNPKTSFRKEEPTTRLYSEGTREVQRLSPSVLPPALDISQSFYLHRYQ